MTEQWRPSPRAGALRPGILRRGLGLTVGAVLLAAGAANGATIRVPQDAATVQGAIDAASDGDLVVVAPGVYRETIEFVGKAITVQSENPTDPATVATTVLDGDGTGPVVTFFDGERRSSVLDGITIRNGSTAFHGGGIAITQASPTIRRCTIENNVAALSGGGVFIQGALANPLLFGNLVRGNRATAQQGGGIACNGSSGEILANRLEANSARSGGGIRLTNAATRVLNNVIFENTAITGGGLQLDSSRASLVRNNTVRRNVATGGAGGAHCTGTAPVLSNMILWENGDNLGGTCTAVHSTIQNGDPGPGNLTLDPRFEPPTGYHLAVDSPCINAGDPALVAFAGEVDIDGDARVVGGRVDMGADERDLNAGFPLNVVSAPETGVLFVVAPDDAQGMGDGTTPFNRIYPPGTNVNVTVRPVDRTFFVRWIVDGVDQPLGEPSAQVRMDGPRRVVASFVAGGSVLVDADGAGDFARVQAAIDAAADGDVIVVRPGIYAERINFNGKRITVQSLAPLDADVVATTVLDGGAAGHVVTFNHAETSESVLRGLTVRGGRASGAANCDADNLPDPSVVPCGGGVYAYTDSNRFTSPTIEHCVIEGNQAVNRGGGVFLKFGAARLFRNVIRNNAATSGAGVSTADISGNTQHNPLLDGNRILANAATNNGGGIFLTSRAATTARSNIIAANTAANGAGIFTQSISANIRYCTVAANRGPGIQASGGNTQVNNGIIWGNADDLRNVAASFSDVGDADPGTGNISLDPRFVDAAAGVFNLLPDSPCIDAGQPGLFVFPGETDVDGQARVVAARVDMGADEVASRGGAAVLWVTSTPNSGVGIDFSPVDLDALGPGVTPFFRTFATDRQAPVVVLTAPHLSPAGQFRRWTLDGVARPNGRRDLVVLMDQVHTARAEYLPLLHVRANLPDATVMLTPPDENGEGDGGSNFTRVYAQGSSVALTAPDTVNATPWVAWFLDGIRQPAGTSLGATMDRSHTAWAVYDTPLHGLSVSATEPATITVDMQDVNGVASGRTPPGFQLTYHEGSSVTLTAPASACVSAFQFWQLDGVAQTAGARQVVVDVTTDRTAVAVYTASGPDCNGNGIGDECDLGAGTAEDCNANGVPDVCDIAAGTSADCGRDGVPDECAPDCDCNGVDDRTDIPVNREVVELPARDVAPGSVSESTWFEPTFAPLYGVRVGVAIEHAHLEELRLELLHENQTVVLWDGGCPGQGAVLRVVFADEGETIPDCRRAKDACAVLAPFELAQGAGTGLAKLRNVEVYGDWKLRVTNRGAGETARLISWSLALAMFDARGSDCNRNGTLDVCDIAARVSGDCDRNGVPDECGCTDDRDGDAVLDLCDNCPAIFNPDQRDGNGDGIGDACRASAGGGGGCIDGDDDTVCDLVDNCPGIANAGQRDSDGDGFGDACDFCTNTSSTINQDRDGDGLGDDCDPCPATLKPAPGLCGCAAPDEDSDGDGVLDCQDACPGAGAVGAVTADGCPLGATGPRPEPEPEPEPEPGQDEGDEPGNTPEPMTPAPFNSLSPMCGRTACGAMDAAVGIIIGLALLPLRLLRRRPL
ncbi:MAG: right-handed parallel beta-helix repeat-containing protein [Planctomycetes bacterium]|nr:right-handed parallel beta-helix repeat-containing protein [Planctomycetota bacterium]